MPIQVEQVEPPAVLVGEQLNPAAFTRITEVTVCSKPATSPRRQSTINIPCPLWGVLDHAHQEWTERAEVACLAFFCLELLLRLRHC
jgi:hypothetical protein